MAKKRDPNAFSPLLYDFLWLYWILKQNNIPRDVIYLIIGNNEKRTIGYDAKYKGFYSIENDYMAELNKEDIKDYYKWQNNPTHSYYGCSCSECSSYF
jgi:hypothetical protein